MPWKLTVPVDVGVMDLADYDQVSIVLFLQDPLSDAITLRVQYGRTIDGVWVPGKTPYGKRSEFVIDGDAYVVLVASAIPDVQIVDPVSEAYAQIGDVWVERTYIAVKRGVYAWLVAQGHVGAGALV